MTMQDRKEIIYQVLEEILENLAFLFFAPEIKQLLFGERLPASRKRALRAD